MRSIVEYVFTDECDLRVGLCRWSSLGHRLVLQRLQGGNGQRVCADKHLVDGRHGNRTLRGRMSAVTCPWLYQLPRYKGIYRGRIRSVHRTQRSAHAPLWRHRAPVYRLGEVSGQPPPGKMFVRRLQQGFYSHFVNTVDCGSAQRGLFSSEADFLSKKLRQINTGRIWNTASTAIVWWTKTAGRLSSMHSCSLHISGCSLRPTERKIARRREEHFWELRDVIVSVSGNHDCSGSRCIESVVSSGE